MEISAMRRYWILAAMLVIVLSFSVFALWDGNAGAQDKQLSDTSPSRQGANETMETAMFGAGCFWGVEAKFREIEGVTATAVGYSGGHSEDPTYKEVCSDTTGHAEVVQVKYDPEKVGYEELLNVFWKGHDPTQKNRQGPDVGSQYRSAIFYFSAEQEKAAKSSLAKLEKEGGYTRPIVTQIEAAKPFYRAEEYHQQYLEKRGLATCHL